MKNFKKIFICSLALLLGTISACNETNVKSEVSTSKEETTQQSSVVESSVSTTSSVAPISTTSSVTSSSTSSSTTSVHVHDYGTLNAGYLPSYFHDGMKPYYYCEGCQQYFDENKNPTTRDALVLPHATDEIAFLIDNNEKEVFTLVEKDDQHASWKIEDRGVSKNSVVAIAKPGDVNYKYAFFRGEGLDSDNKITIDGRVDILLTATDNGFHLEIVEHKFLVVKVNNNEYPLTRVTYLDNTQTYVYGYHNFAIGDKMTVVNKYTNEVLDYDDIEDNSKWNKFDFHRSFSGEFVFDKSGRYGIEFSHDGDKKISVTKVFAPASEGTYNIDFVGERADEEMTAMKVDSDNPELAETKWYITHEAVINADDIKEYVNNNDFYFYYSVISLHANDEFSVKELTGNRVIDADHLVGVYSTREDVVTISNGNIKILKEGMYEVGYISCCDSIMIYEISQSTGDVVALVGGEMITLAKDSNGNVTYTFEASAYSTITFIGLDTTYLPFTLAENYDPTIVSSYSYSGIQMLMILKACTMTFVYNLDTHVLTLSWEFDEVPPADNYFYYLSVLGTLSGNSNQTLSMTIANGKATVKNVALSVNDLVMVQAMEPTTYQSTTYGTLSSDSTPDAFTTFSSYIQVLVAGKYDVSFDLTTTQITITTATN